MGDKRVSAPGRRGEVLRMLRETTRPLSITELADRLDVHPNTVRFHLDTLLANGQVERVEVQHRTPGRPPQLFRAVTGMDPAGPRSYRLLAEILASTLAAEPDRVERAVEAGREWGRQHGDSRPNVPEDPVGRLVALLDEIGFAPELDDKKRRVNLRHCPFLELATERPEVACPIHLGLMQGAMQAWGSPVTVERLDSFVTPDRCVATLAAAQGH